MARRALITGVTGQDGAYLAKFLLEKGYQIYGGVRRTSSPNYWRLRELGVDKEIHFTPLELAEQSNIIRTIDLLQVDEIYNLAAQSFVTISFDQPVYTTEIGGVSVCRLLEAIRVSKAGTRFYQASTSEMFGKAIENPQTELTPFYPRSPYAVAKLYAHWITVNYREAHGLFACSGILFNHESPLRGPDFVTRKITIGLSKIRHGVADVLKLGNLNASRDWGFAADYVRGMWAMLQAQHPDDYVLATGETRTIRNFVERAGALLDFDIQWRGEEEREVGLDAKTGKTIVEVDPALYRPAEVDLIVGDPKKAMEQLSWNRRTSFDQLVEMMVRADSDRVMKATDPFLSG